MRLSKSRALQGRSDEKHNSRKRHLPGHLGYGWTLTGDCARRSRVVPLPSMPRPGLTLGQKTLSVASPRTGAGIVSETGKDAITA